MAETVFTISLSNLFFIRFWSWALLTTHPSCPLKKCLRFRPAQRSASPGSSWFPLSSVLRKHHRLKLKRSQKGSFGSSGLSQYPCLFNMLLWCCLLSIALLPYLVSSVKQLPFKAFSKSAASPLLSAGGSKLVGLFTSISAQFLLSHLKAAEFCLLPPLSGS